MSDDRMKFCGRYYLVVPLLLAAAALALSGCTTTVQKVSKHPGGIGQTPLPAEEKHAEAKLENLDLQQLEARAKESLAEKNFDLARIYLVRALELEPGSPEILTRLGEALLRQGRLLEAEAAVDQAISGDPSHWPALAMAGKISMARGEPLQAKQRLGQALILQPDNPALLTQMAIVYDALGSYTLAEPLYLQVAEMQPTTAAAHNNLGFNLLLQQRYAEAITAFSIARKIAPSDGRIRNNLAAAYALNNQEGAALALFEKSRDQAAAFNNLGFLLMSQEHWPQAERAFRKALQLRPRYYVKAAENLQRLEQVRTDK